MRICSRCVPQGGCARDWNGAERCVFSFGGGRIAVGAAPPRVGRVRNCGSRLRAGLISGETGGTGSTRSVSARRVGRARGLALEDAWAPPPTATKSSRRGLQ